MSAKKAKPLVNCDIFVVLSQVEIFRTIVSFLLDTKSGLNTLLSFSKTCHQIFVWMRRLSHDKKFISSCVSFNRDNKYDKKSFSHLLGETYGEISKRDPMETNFRRFVMSRCHPHFEENFEEQNGKQKLKSSLVLSNVFRTDYFAGSSDIRQKKAFHLIFLSFFQESLYIIKDFKRGKCDSKTLWSFENRKLKIGHRSIHYLRCTSLSRIFYPGQSMIVSPLLSRKETWVEFNSFYFPFHEDYKIDRRFFTNKVRGYCEDDSSHLEFLKQGRRYVMYLKDFREEEQQQEEENEVLSDYLSTYFHNVRYSQLYFFSLPRFSEALSEYISLHHSEVLELSLFDEFQFLQESVGSKTRKHQKLLQLRNCSFLKLFIRHLLKTNNRREPFPDEVMTNEDDEEDDEEEEEDVNIQDAPKRGRPRTSINQSDLQNFNSRMKKQDLYDGISRITNVLNREFNDIQELMEIKSNKPENQGVALGIELFYPERREISIAASFKNGEMIELKRKNLLLPALKDIGHLTGKQLMVLKERRKTSVSGFFDQIGNDSVRKYNRANSDAKSTYRNNLFFLKHPVLGKQVGIMKSLFLIRCEKFLQVTYLKEFLEDIFINIWHSHKRRTEYEMKFEEYVTVNLKNKEKSESVIMIKSTILKICDESNTLDKKLKFNAGYIRDLITRNCMRRKGLYPFLYANHGMNFFERIRCFETGEEQHVSQFESEDLILDSRSVTPLREFIQKLFDLYHHQKVKLKNSVSIVLTEKLLCLADLAEQRTDCLSSLSPSTTRENYSRWVQFLTGDPKSTSSSLIEYKYLITHRLVLDVIRGKKYGGDLTRLFSLFPLQTSLNCINRKTDAHYFLLEMLHCFFSKERPDRVFFVERFLKVVFYFWGISHPERDGKREYCKFLKLKQFFRLLKKGSIKYLPEYEVEFGDSMSFGDQKINLRWYFAMSDPSYPLTMTITKIIDGVLDEEVKGILLNVHKMEMELFQEVSRFQEFVYQEEYYDLDDFLDISECLDFSDAKRDPVCCHILDMFTHYRSSELEKMIPQGVRAGHLKFFDSQNVENNHKSIKYRLYCQVGYTTEKWKSVFAHNISNTDEEEALEKEMIQAFSFFFIYEKIKNDDNYNFISKEHWKQSFEKGPRKIKFERYRLPRPSFSAHSLPGQSNENLGMVHEVSRDSNLRTKKKKEEEEEEEIEGEGERTEVRIVQKKKKKFVPHFMRDEDDDSEEEIDVDTLGDIIRHEFLKAFQSSEESSEEQEESSIENSYKQYRKEKLEKRVELLEELTSNLPVIDHDMSDQYNTDLRNEREKCEKIILQFKRIESLCRFDSNLGEFVLGDESLLGQFTMDMIEGNYEFNKILTPVQQRDVEYIIRMMVEKQRCYFGGEMGYGKTRIWIIVLLILLSNNFVKRVIFVSKGDICIQWMDEIKELCSPETGIGVRPPYMFNYFLASRRKEAVFDEFVEKGGFLFTTKTSVSFPLEKVLSIQKEPYCFVGDEGHLFISRNSSYDEMINLTSNSNCKVCFASGTLFNETLYNTTSSIRIFMGDKEKDFPSVESLRVSLIPFYIRRRVSYPFQVFVKIILLKMNPSYRSFYEQFLQDHGITQTISKTEKWLSSTKAHAMLNSSLNGFDLLLRGFGKKDEIERYLKLFGINDVSVAGHFAKALNPKLHMILSAFRDAVKNSESIILFVNSFPFLKYIEKAMEYFEDDDNYKILKGRTVSIHGTKMTVTQRNAKIQVFNAGGLRNSKCLKAMMGVAGEGLNLSKANHIIIATVPRVAVCLLQMICRILRPHTQKNPSCDITELIFENSLEHHHRNRFVIPRLRDLHYVQDGITIDTRELENLPSVDIESCPRIVKTIVSENGEHVSRVVDFKGQLLGIDNNSN